MTERKLITKSELGGLQKASGDVAITIIFSQTHAWVDDGLTQKNYFTLSDAMRGLLDGFKIKDTHNYDRQRSD